MKPIFTFLALVFLSACNLPVPATVGAAAPTLQVYPTITVTPSVTLTPVPSLTPIPSATPTPDLRMITEDSQNFKLLLSDLPRGYIIEFVPLCGDIYDPQCRLASDRVEGPNLNYEVLQEYGAEKGGRYINATGRVEGWYIYYYYRYSYEEYPRVIMSNVIRFASVEGAREYMRAYANALSTVRYTEELGYPQTGDASRAFVRRFYGDKYLVYEFAYKNIVHRIWFEGSEQNITPNLIQDLSFRALLKLQAAKLNDPPKFISPPTLTPAPYLPNPDERVIDSNPADLALAESDLPAEGKYRVMGKETGPYTNAEFVNAHPSFGALYINKTGRLNGWDVRFQRDANDVLLPAWISDRAILFAEAAGAQTHLNDYADLLLEGEWMEEAPPLIVGDAARVFLREKSVYREYKMIFAYRNAIHELTAYGLQAEVSPAFVEMIAFRLLRNLQDEALLR